MRPVSIKSTALATPIRRGRTHVEPTSGKQAAAVEDEAVLGVLGHDAKVPGDRQAHADAHGRAVHGGDDGRAHVPVLGIGSRHQIHGRMVLAAQGLGLGAHVGPGGERPTGPGHDDGADVIAGIEGSDGVTHLVASGETPGVHPLRVVESDDADGAVVFYKDLLVLIHVALSPVLVVQLDGRGTWQNRGNALRAGTYRLETPIVDRPRQAVPPDAGHGRETLVRRPGVGNTSRRLSTSRARRRGPVAVGAEDLGGPAGPRRFQSAPRTRVPVDDRAPPVPLTSANWQLSTWRWPHSPRNWRVASSSKNMPYVPGWV